MRDREQVLAAGVAAGKFPASRREHYGAMFDRDPEGTERLLEVLEGLPPQLREGLLGATAVAAAPTASEQETVSGWTRLLFPETRPQQIVMNGELVGTGFVAPPAAPAPAHARTSLPPERAPLPPAAPAAASFAPGDVEGWSRELFPEAMREGDPEPRIIMCDGADAPPSAAFEVTEVG